MKKIVALFLVVTSFASVSFGQKDEKSEQILKSVTEKYKSYKSLFASFKIVMENLKDKTTQNQKGNILLKGEKYKLEIPGQVIYCDGKTSWSYLKESNEVQINSIEVKPDAITPANIFTLYENGFESKYIGEQHQKGKTLQQIELIPKDKKKAFYKVQVWINKAEKYVASAKIFNNNGTRLNYSIEKFTPNAPVNDVAFVFDQKKYPGVEIVDLR